MDTYTKTCKSIPFWTKLLLKEKYTEFNLLFIKPYNPQLGSYKGNKLKVYNNTAWLMKNVRYWKIYASIINNPLLIKQALTLHVKIQLIHYILVN